MPKTAIILGASGATGGEVLQLLLNDDRYGKVKLFNRSSINIQHPKIEENIINIFELDKHADYFTADEVYCCIGTTKAKTPDKETYYKIDYGIPAAAAKLAKANGIGTFILVSAIGANKNSSIFYVRIKGEVEETVINEHIANTHILQPSLIVAQRKDNRVMEKVMIGLFALLNPLLFGGAAKYKSIKASQIAKAMVWLANNRYEKLIVTSDKIAELAAK
ncbi:nucleoside-diphosphate sugar epimerase [Flavobacterium zepuense]|uniref:Nucleoside-diphosphate sugar epimerase n=1 Tax=Flavobacterium zepuense TaxID=2593302 RepID=A0A552UVF5_9FLAO|nr:NAD(P)H-binding protein [Flavobacterium zepuense]TRW22221.1 nucleoside-diphosphate sugar epimerase [Flavobacterium zepuense]